MKKTLNYLFEGQEFTQKGFEHGYEYDFVVDAKFEDVRDYLFEKRYNKVYMPTAYYLEPGAKEFVKNLEESWYNNKFDTYELYREYDFTSWLKERYTDEALQCALGSC